MSPFRVLLLFTRGFVRDRKEFALENLALRQQLATSRQQSKRLGLRKRDRIFWAILSRIWAKWRSALLIVPPDTVVRWHRQGFRNSCRWKSQAGRGRPAAFEFVSDISVRLPQKPRDPTMQVPHECAACPRLDSRGTFARADPTHRRPCEHSWTIIWPTSSLSTSSPCRRLHSAYSLPLWSCATTADM